MPLGLKLSEENIPIYISKRERVGNLKTNNRGGERMNPGIRILPLPSANDLLGVRMNHYTSGQLLVHRMENYP